MSDVISAITALKDRMREQYGDVLGKDYPLNPTHDTSEISLTYYTSDILADHGLDHNGQYLWDQKAINAAAVIGYRVAMKDREDREFLLRQQIKDEILSAIDNV